MKVLHVTPSHARRDGGPSETLRGLLPELAKLGVDVTLLSTDKGLAPDDADMHDLCNLVIVRSRPPRALNFAPGMVPQLGKLLSSAEAAHIHSVNTFTTSVAMNMSRLARVPYVLEPHGALDRYHLRQGALKKRVYNNIVDRWGYDGIRLAVYSSSRELTEGSETLSAPGTLMPLGVDERLFSVRRRLGGSPRILFLGRLAHKKRVDLAIRAMTSPALGDLGATLTIAGPMGDDLSFDPPTLARQLGVEDRVSFLGRVDGEQRLELLSTSDVFILPSEDESFGVAVAEAMAAGCAVVASAEVGLVGDASSEDAVISTPLESEAISDALLVAIRDRRAIGKRARRYAEKNFRWASAAAQLAQGYEEIARARRSGA